MKVIETWTVTDSDTPRLCKAFHSIKEENKRGDAEAHYSVVIEFICLLTIFMVVVYVFLCVMLCPPHKWMPDVQQEQILDGQSIEKTKERKK